jgi:hypothetical protein
LSSELFLKDVEINGQKKSVLAKRADKMLSLKNAQDYAERQIGHLSERDIFLLGIGIYIGEGSKTANIIRISNSDPKIIKFSILWLKKCFGLTDENFRIRIHIYPDNDEDIVKYFWMQRLNMDAKFFHPAYIDRRISKQSKKHNILPYRTAHVSVVSNGNKNFGVLLHRKILASIDRVFE